MFCESIPTPVLGAVSAHGNRFEGHVNRNLEQTEEWQSAIRRPAKLETFRHWLT